MLWRSVEDWIGRFGSWFDDVMCVCEEIVVGVDSVDVRLCDVFDGEVWKVGVKEEEMVGCEIIKVSWDEEG